MLQTKKYIRRDVNKIPEDLIYETYLGIKLDGSDKKIRSIFNREETKPSMCVYVHGGKYRWKDFSTGKQGGNAIQLVRELLNCSYEDAVKDIFSRIPDGTYTARKYKPIERITKVEDIVTREFDYRDSNYWSMFSITKEELSEMNIKPIASFTIVKGEESYRFTDVRFVYGFYNQNGCYKIYQPLKKECKFLKISSYIQGEEQLKGKENIIITKSLKDMICLKKIYPDADYIAVDSENTYLEMDYIKKLKKKYKKILVMFDNDRAGKESMKYYRRTFGLPYYIFPFAKDIADSVRYNGLEKTKYYLEQRLRKLL